jgi:hypothetical protein
MRQHLIPSMAEACDSGMTLLGCRDPPISDNNQPDPIFSTSLFRQKREQLVGTATPATLVHILLLSVG